MKTLILKAAVVAGIALAIAAAWWAGQQLGYSDGHAQATQDCLQQHVTRHSQTLADISNAADTARKANLAMNNSISQRREADEQTTRELRHALKQTADQRITCVLPDDVMQQLDAARMRANRAATGGITGAVPGDTGTD